MTAFRVGDVVSVEFPFSDLQTRKRRPGLILVCEIDDLLLARVTTHSPRGALDLALAHWEEAGLPCASTIRLTKLATIDRRLVHHRIGHLHAHDAQSLAGAMQQFAAQIGNQLRS